MYTITSPTQHFGKIRKFIHLFIHLPAFHKSRQHYEKPYNIELVHVMWIFAYKKQMSS